MRSSSDANNDCVVDDKDNEIRKSHDGDTNATKADGDFNGDKVVDAGDYTTWRKASGMSCLPVTPTPSPSKTNSPTITATSTPTVISTPTQTLTLTPNKNLTLTATSNNTLTKTPTLTQTYTATATSTQTLTSTPTTIITATSTPETQSSSKKFRTLKLTSILKNKLRSGYLRNKSH